MKLVKKSKEEQQEEVPIAKTISSEKEYQCPMKCEGDKTYDKPGSCPVCKMDLQPSKSELYF